MIPAFTDASFAVGKPREVVSCGDGGVSLLQVLLSMPVTLQTGQAKCQRASQPSDYHQFVMQIYIKKMLIRTYSCNTSLLGSLSSTQYWNAVFHNDRMGSVNYT